MLLAYCLPQICAASNYGGVCFTQPLKVFVYSSEAVRDLGSFDVTAAAAAAAAGLDVAAAAAAAAGRGGSMSDDNTSCSDDSMSGCCARLLPCVALLQGLELMDDSCSDKIVITPDTPDITEDNSVDDVSCDSSSCGGGQKLAAAAAGEDAAGLDAAEGMVMGSCLDLESLGAGCGGCGGHGLTAAALDGVAAGAEDAGLLLLRGGGAGDGSENGAAENFDCMSVASEATGLVGEGCGGSGGAAAAGGGGGEAEMGEVSSACV
jgi:hypothetical protein